MKACEQLGDFLRSRRERLQPVQARSETRRRRTPGLRREEVARLAGMSVEWYIKLEQGRVVRPSDDTINAIARALRLTESDHTHLRTLARGVERSRSIPETVPETLLGLVRSWPHPAYVTGLRWDILAWNEATRALFLDLSELSGIQRNILHYMLTNPNARILFGDTWPDEARRMVALFRVAYDTHSNDPAFGELVAAINKGCPEFAAWWNAHEVAVPESGTKELTHATRGVLKFNYTTLLSNDDSRLKIAFYVPAV